MAVEVAAFDCSSSNDSISSMTGRRDSKLIGNALALTKLHPCIYKLAFDLLAQLKGCSADADFAGLCSVSVHQLSRLQFA